MPGGYWRQSSLLLKPFNELVLVMPKSLLPVGCRRRNEARFAHSQEQLVSQRSQYSQNPISSREITVEDVEVLAAALPQVDRSRTQYSNLCRIQRGDHAAGPEACPREIQLFSIKTSQTNRGAIDEEALAPRTETAFDYDGMPFCAEAEFDLGTEVRLKGTEPSAQDCLQFRTEQRQESYYGNSDLNPIRSRHAPRGFGRLTRAGLHSCADNAGS